MALEIIRADGRDSNFILLTNLLDKDLEGRYGELQKSYSAYNGIDHIKNAVVVLKDGLPVACGAFKEFSPDTVEMKRVFVPEEQRRRGFARLVMAELEAFAKDGGYRSAVLETGIRNFEAIGLYRSLGYETIENYAQYAGNPNSVCMKKKL